MKMLQVFIRAAAAALFAATAAIAQPLPSAPGERAWSPKAQPAPALRIDAKAARTRIPLFETELSPIADSEIEAVRRANRRSDPAKRLVIGVNRPLEGDSALPAAQDLAWVRVEGGHAAQAVVTSLEAAALRLGLELAGVPEDVEMVFYGSADATRLIGPIRVGDIPDRSTRWWSPVTEGDTQSVEFFVPGERDAKRLPIRVVQVSHLLAGPSGAFQKRVQDIGDSGACNIDIPCSPLNSNAAFQNVTDAVAKMVFTDGSFTALCTGTLLNDTEGASQVPWFYGANHCFENESPPYKTPAQMQQVANTLNTFWFFEANACRSLTPSSSYRQLGGGATLIYNSQPRDVLFLRLNNAPPAGAFYSGWDANALSNGVPIIAIHHPSGDLKKVTEGNFAGYGMPPSTSLGQLIQARWTSGTTEPGSSGGGVWTYDGASYLLRGGLYGGYASCSNLSGIDYYSRFDQVFATLAPYLNPKVGPTSDYTDLWWNPNESGWGLNLIQHASSNIFGVWYTYAADGKRTWYVMPGGTWAASNVFTGDLYVTSGPPANDPSFDTRRVAPRVVGRATLSFSDSSNGTFAYSVDGVSGTKSITRQSF
jgi:lysyl endopeptidase